MGDNDAPVIWFTGLSGAGKTTLARATADALIAAGRRVELLDGDALRHAFPLTGFSRLERDMHVRRVGFLASRLAHHGIVVVAALISPFAESRAFVRSLCGNFAEVYVSTPLAECERRDVKQLYARARRGEISDFTGISSPYEPPASPDVTLDTRFCSVEDGVAQVLRAVLVEGGLQRRGN